MNVEGAIREPVGVDALFIARLSRAASAGLRDLGMDVGEVDALRRRECGRNAGFSSYPLTHFFALL